MTPGLMNRMISLSGETFDKVTTADITGHLHIAINSSFTI